MQRIARSRFQLRRTVIANASPFTAKTFRSGFADEQWQFEFGYAWMTREEALPLIGAIAGQRGGLGDLAVYDPDFIKPLPGSRAAVTNGIVAAPNQTGSTLFVGFGGAVGSLVARTGERVWVTYPGPVYRMFTLISDCVTTVGGGGATMQLDRPLRIAPANAAAVGFDWVTSFRGIPARLEVSDQESDRVGNMRLTISGLEIV